jgi:hypothetical protein
MAVSFSRAFLSRLHLSSSSSAKESQQDSISQPKVAEATLGVRFKNSSTLKALNQSSSLRFNSFRVDDFAGRRPA